MIKIVELLLHFEVEKLRDEDRLRYEQVLKNPELIEKEIFGMRFRLVSPRVGSSVKVCTSVSGYSLVFHPITLIYFINKKL